MQIILVDNSVCMQEAKVTSNSAMHYRTTHSVDVLTSPEPGSTSVGSLG